MRDKHIGHRGIRTACTADTEWVMGAMEWAVCTAVWAECTADLAACMADLAACMVDITRTVCTMERSDKLAIECECRIRKKWNEEKEENVHWNISID